MTIYLDCDGVLADFEKGFRDIFGETSASYEAQHGSANFWHDIAALDDFYGQLPLMPDAYSLFMPIRHLDPVILTGLPRGDWAEPQKRRWAARHFPGTKVITCLAKNKALYRAPGDVLIDDRDQYAALWRLNGGVFIHHTSASASLAQLAKELTI